MLRVDTFARARAVRTGAVEFYISDFNRIDRRGGSRFRTPTRLQSGRALSYNVHIIGHAHCSKDSRSTSCFTHEKRSAVVRLPGSLRGKRHKRHLRKRQNKGLVVNRTAKTQTDWSIARPPDYKNVDRKPRSKNKGKISEGSDGKAPTEWIEDLPTDSKEPPTAGK